MIGIDIKIVALLLLSSVGMFAAASGVEGSQDWLTRMIKVVLEFGSFGVIAFLVVYTVYKVLPQTFAHMTEMRRDFLEELREERKHREEFHKRTRESLKELSDSIRRFDK